MIQDSNATATPRRWFTDGATMAFPSRSRMVYWVINLLLYVLLCMFVLRIQTGVWLELGGPYESGPLVNDLLEPVSIFYFPTQILVIGLATALLCTVPILTAQLYNFLYGVPFALVVFFVGHNPAMSLCLFVSCALASFEPLRFKSKFVAAVVCLLPILLYWVLFFGAENPEQDAWRWAVLYAPWGLAFFISVFVIGVVLTIGHFLRYRPGVLMPAFALLTALTVLLFRFTVGMHERDYLAEVYRYSPARIAAFESRSIKPLLEAELAPTPRSDPLPARRANHGTATSRMAVGFSRRPPRHRRFRRGARHGLGKFRSAWPPRRSADLSTRKSRPITHINDFLAKHKDGPPRGRCTIRQGTTLRPQC